MVNWVQRPRVFLWAGFALMLAGALDPLEGSVVILAGSVVAAIAAWAGRARRRLLQIGAMLSIGVGVALLFGMSALGGVGGRSGHSIWWLLLLVPYPIGWVLGLVGAVQNLRGLPRRTVQA